MRDDMVLKDVNGVIHAITRRNIGWMLGAGWLFYFASFILNIIYYIIPRTLLVGNIYLF